MQRQLRHFVEIVNLFEPLYLAAVPRVNAIEYLDRLDTNLSKLSEVVLPRNSVECVQVDIFKECLWLNSVEGRRIETFDEGF